MLRNSQKRNILTSQRSASGFIVVPSHNKDAKFAFIYITLIKGDSAAALRNERTLKDSITSEL